MRICFVTPELAPLAKVGGLADVSAALPRELHRMGHDVRVYLPLYRRVRESAATLQPDSGPLSASLGSRNFRYTIQTTRLPRSEVDVRLVDCPELYDRPGIYTEDDDEHLRFLLLTRAALDGCQQAQWAPDILHCHDWQTALGPLYLKSVYAWDRLFERTRSVLTIHNLGHQGTLPAAALPDLGLGNNVRYLHQDDLRTGRIGFLKTGLGYADVLTTVSPTYAREIQQSRMGMGLDGVLRQRSATLFGILNGIDTDEWNPRTDRHLEARYSEKSLWRKEKNKEALLASLGLPYEKGVPVVGIVTRLSAQKGIELLDPTLPELLRERDIRFVALGSGEPRLEQLLSGIQARFPGRACFYRGFSDELAHRIEGGTDFFLTPSLYEPCGLNQMYSMRYGTAPVVRATGGLADTVTPFDAASGEGTGFVFEDFTAGGLHGALTQALQTYADPKAWRRLQLNGMGADFSWRTSAQRYEDLYRQVTATAEVRR